MRVMASFGLAAVITLGLWIVGFDGFNSLAPSGRFRLPPAAFVKSVLSSGDGRERACSAFRVYIGECETFSVLIW